jgi:hypothetical protein
VYGFVVWTSGPSLLAPQTMERLIAAGCRDAVYATRDGHDLAIFSRRGESQAEAIREAVEAMAGAVPGLKIERVAPRSSRPGHVEGLSDLLPPVIRRPVMAAAEVARHPLEPFGQPDRVEYAMSLPVAEADPLTPVAH